MKSTTKTTIKNSLINIIASAFLIALLIIAVIGIQKTQLQQQKFDSITQEADAFTTQLEEKYPALKETRESAEQSLKDILPEA